MKLQFMMICLALRECLACSGKLDGAILPNRFEPRSLRLLCQARDNGCDMDHIPWRVAAKVI